MKSLVALMIVSMLTLTFACGCNQKTSDKPQQNKSGTTLYESVAVMPITGELKIEFKGTPDAQTAFLQADFPEELAGEILKRRPAESFKVVSPAEVKEKQKPDLGVRELGKSLGAKVILVGRAEPNTNRITFQLIVTETGDLLWSEAFPVREFRGVAGAYRPQLQDQEHIVQTVSGQVVKTLAGDKSK
jgi:TolB-like protein